jgi:hypothetical protein
MKWEIDLENRENRGFLSSQSGRMVEIGENLTGIGKVGRYALGLHSVHQSSKSVFHTFFVRAFRYSLDIWFIAWP